MEQEKKVRVLHVLPWVTAGGVERLRANIAEESHASFEHRIFTFVANGYNADRIRAAGVSITTASVNALWGLAPFQELAGMVRAYRPHILHGAVFEGVILAATVGRLLRVPVILGEETSFATNRSPRGHALFRALSMLTDGTVAISPEVAEKLRDVTGVSSKKIHVIVNGVDPLRVADEATRRVAKSRFGIPEDARVLGTMSRLVSDENKRVSDILHAMTRVRQHAPDVHLLICGDGKERPLLERLTDELGLRDCVHFAGTVVPQDGFDAMDIFVHVASREGFGLAVAEAAFCALPMVTTGVGGIASIVEPDVSALIVPVGAPDAIADAVYALLDDPERSNRMGQAGRARALARFSSTRYVHDVETLYRQMLREKKVRV